jgi:hypothetical protein
VIDDESLLKTRTNTCLSYASAIPSYSVVIGMQLPEKYKEMFDVSSKGPCNEAPSFETS